jgi:hypothetical protein
VTAFCSHCGAPLPAQSLGIRETAVVLAPIEHERQGLLAWAHLRVGPFRLAGLSVRRTGLGELTVTFPARKDARGALHREITLLDDDLDRRVRAAVLAAYIAERGRAGRREP